MKVSLLQDSFVREIWNQIGKQAYLEIIHPLVISNLYISPHKSSAAAASVLLICSSEELGVPITVHQVNLFYGNWFCSEGIKFGHIILYVIHRSNSLRDYNDKFLILNVDGPASDSMLWKGTMP